MYLWFEKVKYITPLLYARDTRVETEPRPLCECARTALTPLRGVIIPKLQINRNNQRIGMDKQSARTEIPFSGALGNQ